MTKPAARSIPLTLTAWVNRIHSMWAHGRVHQKIDLDDWLNYYDEAISRLAKCTSELHDSTKDMVGVWEAGSGVFRFARGFGKFVKWLSGFAVLGAVFGWFNR